MTAAVVVVLVEVEVVVVMVFGKAAGEVVLVL